MNKLLIPTLALSATIISSCVIFDDPCQDDIEDANNRYSASQDRRESNFVSDGYETLTIYWWDLGVSKTFTSGDNISGCEVTTNRFTPIR